MQWTDRLKSIEARAGALNLTLHALCVEAEVSPSTLWRLGRTGYNPRVLTIDRVLKPIEDLLDKKEAKTRRALARRERPRAVA